MLIKGKSMKEIHLICNAHIDPIWQWEWEEGAAAAVSTFRSAADLADEFDYIFCHNEVTLYKYISEFAPTLFERIKELVRQGKWHVMGGWYLQPDCNMPCGESVVRQILVGQKYFYENFGVKPTTAVNFDSFGHSRGLVQIMKNCGQDSYIFCRSGNDPLPAKQFIWKGFDGSTIKAQHAQTYYSSLLGEAAKAIQDKANAQQEDTVCVLWGVGNHGGGPSRKDLADIKELIAESEDRIIHSTPEAFFAKIEPTAVHEKSLRTVMPGCYTSSSRIKRRHAELENTLWMTEKMCASAAMRGVAEYPEKEINEAVEDLLNSEFHDVLCGCTIRAGEENGLRILDHGLQNLNKIRAKAFFALSSAEPSAREGELPILVFNPHPYELETEVSCEFMLADQNWKEDIRSSVHVTDSEEKEIPVQLIKEESNLNLDWRKRIVFNAKLKPLGITRFSVWIDYISQDNTNGFVAKAEPASEDIVFDCNGKHVEIDAKSGLIKSFRLNGREYIKGEAFRPIFCHVNEDPWAMGEAQLKKIGTHPISFKLMKNPDGPFEGLAPIRIIEDGSVYLGVECFMKCRNTRLRLEYDIYKNSPYIDVKVDVFPGDINRILKIEIPCADSGKFIGQTAYGAEELYSDGRECVAQRYIALKNGEGECVALFNRGVYGSSFSGGVMRQSLLRTASYCAHPINGRTLVPTDRYVKKIDLCEQNFEFRLAVCHEDMLEKAAAEFNQPAYALNVFPVPCGKAVPEVPIGISDPSVILSAAKKEDGGERFVFRLFNGTGSERSCDFTVSAKNLKLNFSAYEMKTVSFDGENLIEENTAII